MSTPEPIHGSAPRLIDAHNHLQDGWLAPHLPVVEIQLHAIGLRAAVVNGTCEADWADVARLARRYEWVRPSYGLHPWHAGNRSADWLDRLKAVLAADPTAAVGEVGIDQWMLKLARADEPRLAGLRRASLAEQTAVLTAQCELAAADDRALTIHCLQAWGALDDLLHSIRLPERGFLLHAYGGSREMIPRFVRLGAYFSFNACFLDVRRGSRREVFNEIPDDRLLVETDAPAMIPPPEWRSQSLPDADGSPVNHPANIEAAYAGLAEWRGVPPERLAEQVSANFTRLFG